MLWLYRPAHIWQLQWQHVKKHYHSNLFCCCLSIEYTFISMQSSVSLLLIPAFYISCLPWEQLFTMRTNLSMSRFSDVMPYIYLSAINFNLSASPWSMIEWKIFSMKLCKPLLIPSISYSTFSTNCTNFLLFFIFELHFYFIKIKSIILRIFFFLLQFGLESINKEKF